MYRQLEKEIEITEKYITELYMFNTKSCYIIDKDLKNIESKVIWNDEVAEKLHNEYVEYLPFLKKNLYQLQLKEK